MCVAFWLAGSFYKLIFPSFFPLQQKVPEFLFVRLHIFTFFTWSREKHWSRYVRWSSCVSVDFTRFIWKSFGLSQLFEMSSFYFLILQTHKLAILRSVWGYILRQCFVGWRLFEFWKRAFDENTLFGKKKCKNLNCIPKKKLEI